MSDDAKDAARYRFLRSRGRPNSVSDFAVYRGIPGMGIALWNGWQLDGAIDEAIEARAESRRQHQQPDIQTLGGLADPST